MTTPFREDALALASVDAPPVLAKWDAEENPLELRLAMFFLGRLYAPMRSSDATAGKLTGDAELLGLRYLGRFRFAGLIPFFGPVRETWVDRGGVVRVSFRREAPRGLIEAAMGPYLLTTTFDDGTAITTWSRQIQLPPSTIAVNRVGTGKLVTDYESHRAAVATHTNETCRPLRIPDLDTALAIATHYDRRISPWAIVSVAKARAMMLGLGALAVLVVIQMLRR